MNIFADFESRVKAAVEAVLSDSENGVPDLARVTVEPPRDAAHGDLATNAAMVLAKPLGLKPRDLATRIAAHLARDPDVETAEIAGPATRIRGELAAILGDAAAVASLEAFEATALAMVQREAATLDSFFSTTAARCEVNLTEPNRPSLEGANNIAGA